MRLFVQQYGHACEARHGLDDQHDRYLLVDDRAFLSGASFKDLGGKESVVTELRSLRDELETSFERKWEAATIV